MPKKNEKQVVVNPVIVTENKPQHIPDRYQELYNIFSEYSGDYAKLDEKLREIEKVNVNAEVVDARGENSTLAGRFDNVSAQLAYKATIQDENVIYRIPTDYENLQVAIDTLSVLKSKQGKTITLLLETGYRPLSGIKVENGDYRHFIITSEDSEVVLHDNFSGNFLEARRAVAPRLSCLVNANFKGNAGVWLDDQSDGFISIGCGVKNTFDRGLYVNKDSRVYAEGSIFTGGRIQSLWVSRVSTAFVDNAFFGGGGSESLDEPVSVHISRQSRVYGLNLNVENSLGTAVKVQRGSVLSAPNCNFSGASLNGVQVTGGSQSYLESANISNTGRIGLSVQSSVVNAINSTISAKVGNVSNGVVVENASNVDIDGASISQFGKYGLLINRNGTLNASSVVVSNSGNHGVYCEQSSRVNLRGASVKNSGGKDLSVLRGGNISAHDCKTTNSETSPAIADTNVSAFNTISSSGIIWT